MKPEVLKYLEDINLSIQAIEKYISDLTTVEEYEKDMETIDAVERRLAIIGEALFKANKIEPKIEISNKKKIIALRHILVHEYDLISNSTIWQILKYNLPVLKTEISHLLL
jgi:uncharacterized protein with HEPN domain